MSKAIYTLMFLACFFGMRLPAEAKPVDKQGIPSIANPGYQSISGSKFLDVFRDHICQRLGKDRSDVIVSNFKVIANKPVRSGGVTLNVFQKGKTRLKRQVRLVALISVDGVVKNKVRMSGWVDVFDFVVCASRHLKRGEIIEKDDVYLARKNISRLSANILTDTSKVVGSKVKHNIEEDTCLKAWMLEKSPIVNRGDMVTILAESGDLRVTVPGQVLEKGYLGELIRVQNSMSKERIHARVINHSTVMVDF